MLKFLGIEIEHLKAHEFYLDSIKPDFLDPFFPVSAYHFIMPNRSSPVDDFHITKEYLIVDQFLSITKLIRF